MIIGIASTHRIGRDSSLSDHWVPGDLLPGGPGDPGAAPGHLALQDLPEIPDGHGTPPGHLALEDFPEVPDGPGPSPGQLASQDLPEIPDGHGTPPGHFALQDLPEVPGGAGANPINHPPGANPAINHLPAGNQPGRQSS